MADVAAREQGIAVVVETTERYVHCKMEGRMVPEVVDALIPKIARAGWRRWWLLDALGVTGFSPMSIGAGRRVLENGRSHGMVGIIVVTELPAARMAARTAALAAGMAVHVVSTIPEAVRLAATQ